jgi:hypothetical protein
MKKRLGIYAITLVIAGLVITSTAASISQISQKEIFEDQTIVGVPIELTSTDATVSTVNFLKPHMISPSANPLSRGTDVLVWQDVENDCQNPATVTDVGFQNILVFTEIIRDSDQTALWGRWSINGGVEWSEDAAGWDEVSPIQGDYDDVSQPRLDYYGEESWAYGTWTAGSTYHATTYYLELPSIVDPSYDPNGYGWVYYMVDWGESHDFSDFDSADVGCFPYDPDVSPSADFWGIIALTGDRPPGENEEDDTMMFTMFTEGGGVTIISFHNLNTDVSKMSTDVDISLGQFYMAMEYVDEADENNTGTRFQKSPKFQPDPDWWQGSYPGFLFAGAYNPDITAADGYVYIVVETIEDGYKDIVCLYSSNGGSTFGQSEITATASEDEMFPNVAISEDKVVCTYTRDGNLITAISEDNGVSWTEETEKVNDQEGTVVEQYGNAGIDGPYAAWTDERSSPWEIYFDTTIEPPEVPDLEISDIKGGIGVKATVKNVGEAPATNANWQMTVTGGILGFIDVQKSGTESSLAVGAEVTAKSGLILGFGPLTIEVSANCDEGASDSADAIGRQLLFFSLIS